MSLEIKIGNIEFRNPLLIASGVLGSNPQLYIRAWQAGAGGIVTKTFTVKKREGYRTPIIISVNCGFINAVGLENPGIEGMNYVLHILKKHAAEFIVSIAGSTPEEFLKLATRAYDLGAKAVELNLSCPHAKRLGLEIGMDADLVRKIIKTLKDDTDLAIFAKLGYFPKIEYIAKIAELAGADAIVAINTIRSMKIDVWIKKPILSNKYGGLSGPAIHPIAVATVYSLYEKLEIPLIASGGISTWEDAVEFLLAGASAFQIGSILSKKNFDAIPEILNGIKQYMKEQNIKTIKEIVGLAHE